MVARRRKLPVNALACDRSCVAPIDSDVVLDQPGDQLARILLALDLQPVERFGNADAGHYAGGGKPAIPDRGVGQRGGNGTNRDCPRFHPGDYLSEADHRGTHGRFA